MPAGPPASLRIWALIPITRPGASSSGPPELPWAIGASIWIASINWKCGAVRAAIDRPTAETTPTASESSLPSGLPIAATGSPTATSAERPSGSTWSAWAEGATRITPTSSKTSQPTTVAGIRSWSENST